MIFSNLKLVAMCVLLCVTVASAQDDYPKASYPKAKPGNVSKQSKTGLVTQVARWASLRSTIELSYQAQGSRYRIYCSDEHGVNTILTFCKSADLTKLLNLLLKAGDKTGDLAVGQSFSVGVLRLTGATFHFTAHRDADLGAWIQVMVTDSSGVDTVSYGVFNARELEGLANFFDSRYRR